MWFTHRYHIFKGIITSTVIHVQDQIYQFHSQSGNPGLIVCTCIYNDPTKISSK